MIITEGLITSALYVTSTLENGAASELLKLVRKMSEGQPVKKRELELCIVNLTEINIFQ